jgi:radical SAM protein (TIGR01212 family)
VSGPGPFFQGARYNSYGTFLRQKFGCRVNKVIVDAGFTCPNRDGTVGFGGCTYCNNDVFRPSSADRALPPKTQVENGIRFLRRRFRSDKFIVYFQPFSNTYAPLDVLIPLYEEALAHQDVVGLAVGTRADCIDEAKIAWFENCARRTFVTLEYGLESIHDRTLQRINRGHDFRAFVDAVRLTRNRGIFICAHVILGFPWETPQEILETARVVSELGLDFIKLNHLHVVRDTAMGREFQAEPFRVPGFEEYVDLVVQFLEQLSPLVWVERLFGLAPEPQLLGPNWGRSRVEIQRVIEHELAARDTYQGRLYRAQAIPQ